MIEELCDSGRGTISSGLIFFSQPEDMQEAHFLAVEGVSPISH